MYSDVHSSSGRSVAASAPAAQPPPAYIASAAASQLISAELEEVVAVSPSALSLVNSFLDQVLFNILATAHSANLSQLRTAIPVVLKPRLGKAALKVADDELSEYLEDSDGEAPHPIQISYSDFDPDLAWRLARLRCMVYTRLGDLEEEDEEEILEQEQLNRHGRNVRQATHLGPASAIFLTAVLEYLGEQALYYAAQHAQRRAQTNRTDEPEPSPGDHADETYSLVIEESDMSQIGRESPLSRLWRSWRRDTRLPREGFSSPISPDSQTFPSENVLGTANAPISTITEEHAPMTSSTEERSPAQIPLPIAEQDINEIEGAGSKQDIFRGEGAEPKLRAKQTGTRRPTSMIGNSSNTAVPLTPTSNDEPPTFQERSPQRPRVKHRRSHSLPTLSQSPPATAKTRESPETTLGSVLGTHDTRGPAATSQSEGPAKSYTQNDPDESLSAEDDQQVGRVAAALSAVAGALGMGATSAESQSSSTHHAQTSDIKGRTIAEQMIGPSSSVAPPRNAATGPSITSKADFNGIHVPENATTPAEEHIHIPHADRSDPEDLALSSGDEEPEEMVDSARASQTARSPQAAAGNSFYHDSDAEDEPQQTAESETDSSPTVRKRPSDYDTKNARRQATIYQESLEQSPELPSLKPTMMTKNPQPRGADPSPLSASFDRSQQILSSEMVTAGEPSVEPSIYSSNEEGRSVAAATRPITAERNRTPPPLSPKYRQDTVQAHATSKPSQPTQDTRGSSGSSNKHPGLDKEQQDHVASVVPRGSVIGAGNPSDTVQKRSHLRLRTDSDNTEDEDTGKKRSLEQLIDSDETLHYILTPLAARAENVNISPRPKTQTQELADFFKNTKPPTEEKKSPKLTRATVPIGLNGLRANPTTIDTSPQSRKVIPSSKNIPPIAVMSKKTASPLGTPRDARIERDATRDLADYARSTGPDSPAQLPKPLASPASRPGTTTSTASRPSASRLKYQAREATTSRHAESSELIDFIREGPPRAPGDHRIDRNVAPFRRTMDSDDINGLAHPHERDNGSSSVDSARNGSIAQSAHSRTPLLDSSNRLQAVAAGAVQPVSSASLRQRALAQDFDAPKRTQRRVRDPYAIDYSDDDLEGEEEVVKPKPKTQDESLIDFLRNTAPTPSMTARPIIAADSSTAAVSAVRRAGNQPGPNERVTRNTSMQGLDQKGVKADDGTGASGHTTSSGSNSNRARTDSPHLTQAGSKIDSYRPTKPTHADFVEKSRAKSRIEAREPRTSGNTSDLADYLKNSGPATPPPTTTPPYDDAKEEAGFLRFFSRRKSVKH